MYILVKVFRIFREENETKPATGNCSLIAPRVPDKKPKYRFFIERRKSAVFWNRNFIFRKNTFSQVNPGSFCKLGTYSRKEPIFFGLRWVFSLERIFFRNSKADSVSSAIVFLTIFDRK